MSQAKTSAPNILMRIAVVNWSRRLTGGTETYVNHVIVGLHELGHELLSLTEADEPVSREQMTLPPGLPALCVAEIGRDAALAALRDWHPDVIYAHGIHDPELERDVIRIAPSIFFAHTFTGTCISGQKTFKNPVVQPCTRQFGWHCLLHYYPHRCGGLNPITMARMYLTQTKRLENLRQYQAIITHSSYMYEEFVTHGFDPGCLHKLSDYSHTNSPDSPATTEESHFDDSFVTDAPPRSKADELTRGSGETANRLLYIGRMEFLKGGEVFLDTLHQAQARLGRPLRVTFAGDGADRRKWESKAADLQSKNPELAIEFVGWMSGPELDSILANIDLLVFPSLWPEPFGLVGLEAGRSGVPVAAFAVGGIPDWLFDGINGYLAPADPPTAGGLADAIVKCLEDPRHYAELRRGAAKVSQSLGMDSELNAFLKVLEQVGNRSNSPEAAMNAEGRG